MINEQPIMNFTIPAKHMEIRLVRALETYLLGSRGSLKTTLGCALYCIDMIYEMPRSTGVIVVPNYEHFDKNTFEPLLKGWARLGYKADEHFVIDKRPQESWPKPYDFEGAKKYDRVISWHNGTVIKIISLARIGAANAVSAQWGFFDELKFMKSTSLEEVFPIFRGNEEYFGESSCYLSKFFATDKLADPAEIEWILNKRNLVDHRKVESIIPVQLHVNYLKTQLVDIPQSKQAPIKKQIFELERRLKLDRANLVYVAEINCYDVLPILGNKWLNSQKTLCKSKRTWEVAFENKDPQKPGESFYPLFDESIHTYNTVGTEDIDLSRPFIISSDYQHTVAPIPVAQIGKLPGMTSNSLNYIDYIYSLYPEGLRDAVKKFCDKYINHLTKRVYYVYDHTAIGKRVDADEYFTIVKKELIANKWKVIDRFTGQAPGHYQKYSDTSDWLEHKDAADLPIRMHAVRCRKLIKSITGSPAKTTAGKTEKDKKYESTSTYPDLDQSETTHGSDAFDMINDAVLKQKLIKASPQRIPLAFGGKAT
jgi:hypothetical protein